jgi:GxxExxY protein
MSSISFTILKDLAADVYAKIGPWASESIYQNAMRFALIKAGFSVEAERDIPVDYDGMYVGTVRADLVVSKTLVVELKAVAGASKSTVDTAVMQCRHYLRLTGIAAGAVVVFPQRSGQDVYCREVRLADPESDVSESDEPAAPLLVPAPNPFDDDVPEPASKRGRKKGPMDPDVKARMNAKRQATMAKKAAIAAARAEANED